MTEREREAAFDSMIAEMRRQADAFSKPRASISSVTEETASSRTPCKMIAAKFRGDGAVGVLS
jgi:hypothetical protein